MPASPWTPKAAAADPAPVSRPTAESDFPIDRTAWPPEGFTVAPAPDLMRLPPVETAQNWAKPVVGASFAEDMAPTTEHVYAQPGQFGASALPECSPLAESGDRSGGLPAYGFPYRQDDYGNRCLAELHQAWQDIKSDYGNYYSWPTLRDMGLMLAITAPIANTAVDQNFRNWYQDDVRSTGTNNFASFWKPLGEGAYVIPGFLGVAVVGKCFDQPPIFHVAGELGDRTTRAYLVGAPPMLFMQYLLGAGRPTTDIPYPSYWRPFNDSHGVSGHAFMGAVPFITAAKMSDNLAIKSGCYLLSTFTAWSRINDDAHFLSQVILGWSMAYYAARAVDNTETDKSLMILPVAAPDMTGVQVIYTF